MSGLIEDPLSVLDARGRLGLSAIWYRSDMERIVREMIEADAYAVSDRISDDVIKSLCDEYRFALTSAILVDDPSRCRISAQVGAWSTNHVHAFSIFIEHSGPRVQLNTSTTPIRVIATLVFSLRRTDSLRTDELSAIRALRTTLYARADVTTHHLDTGASWIVPLTDPSSS